MTGLSEFFLGGFAFTCVVKVTVPFLDEVEILCKL